MSPDRELQAAYREMVTSGRSFIRAWARVHAPQLPAATLAIIVDAIGEISIDQAIMAMLRETRHALRERTAP